jgi:hypothetical protein
VAQLGALSALWYTTSRTLTTAERFGYEIARLETLGGFILRDAVDPPGQPAGGVSG